MKNLRNCSLSKNCSSAPFVVKPLLIALLGVMTTFVEAVEVNTAITVNPEEWNSSEYIDQVARYKNKDIWFGHFDRDNALKYQGKTEQTYTYYIGGVNKETNITLAHKAKVLVTNDALTRVLGFGQSSEQSYDPTYTPGGISYGTYRKSRAGSVIIGSAQLIWNTDQKPTDLNSMGDMSDFASNWDGQYQSGLDDNLLGLAVTQLGTNSFQQGHFSTLLGSYSLNSNLRRGVYGSVGMFSVLNGSLNSNENFNSNKEQSGVLNQLNGAVNIVNQSNGVSIQGAGNKVAGSYDQALSGYNALLTKEAQSNRSPYDHVTDLQNAALKEIQTNSGKDIQIAGYGNTISNAELLTVMGNVNTVSNTAHSVVLGDHYKLDDANNVVMLGGNDSMPVEAFSQTGAIVIGRNARVTYENGIVIGPNAVNEHEGTLVLGSDSHSVDFNTQQRPGWHSTTRTASTDITNVWMPTMAGVSIGDAAKKVTRQIQGVAAGAEDADLANVAQLKLAARTLSVNGGTNFTSKVDGQVQAVKGGNLTISTSRVTDGDFQGLTHVDLGLNNQLSLNNGAVSIDGTQSQMTVGSGSSSIAVNGEEGFIIAGKMTISDGSITGLANTTWSNEDVQAKRMATEDQLSQVDQRITDLNLVSRQTALEEKVSTLGENYTNSQKELSDLKISDADTRTTTLQNNIKAKDEKLAKERWIAATVEPKDGGVLEVKSTDNTDATKDNQIHRDEAFELVAGKNMTLSLAKDGTEVSYVLGVSKDIKGLKGVTVANGVSLALSDDGGTITLDGQPDSQGRLGSPAGAVATLKDGQAYATDRGRGTGTLNQAMSITGGVAEPSKLTTGNIGVKVKEGGLSIELAQNLDLTDQGSVTLGQVRVGKDASGQAGITGLKTSTDYTGDDSAVVTEGQLAALKGNSVAVDQGAAQLRRQLNDLDVDMRDMGATAAAMAALKPVSFDPNKPSQVMFGAGAYRGREAVAMGLGHYINDSVFVNAGLAVGRSKMANVGLTFSFGGPKKAPEMTAAQVSTSLQQMGVRLDQLKAENEALDEANRQLDARHQQLSETHQGLVKQQQRLQALSSQIYHRLQALLAAQ